MPRGRQASARISASEGSPCVVRSPASRMRSAFSAMAANDARTSSRRSGEQWTSPAAAILTVARFTIRRGRVPGGPMPNEDLDAMLATLKKSAAALRDADVPFALGGGLAAWARGGPETEHDVDVLVKPDDAERALAALVEAGFRPEPAI